MSDLYSKDYQKANFQGAHIKAEEKPVVNLEKKPQEPKKKPKRKKGFLFWASLTIMIAALIALAVIGAGYLQGCLLYKNISDDTFDDGNLNLADMKVDWDKLRAINPDTVA